MQLFGVFLGGPSSSLARTGVQDVNQYGSTYHQIERGEVIGAPRKEEAGGRGLYSWQSGEGEQYLIGRGVLRLDSDDTSPLYKNHCFTVGLVQILRTAAPIRYWLRAASP
jgi:hypothetical protein